MYMKKISRVSILSGFYTALLVFFCVLSVSGTVLADQERTWAKIITHDTSADFEIRVDNAIDSTVVIKCAGCNNGADIRVVATKSPILDTLYKGTLAPLVPEKAYRYEVFAGDGHSIKSVQGEFITRAAGTGDSTDAQPIVGQIEVKYDNPLGNTKTLPDFAIIVLDGAVLLLTPIVVIMLLYAGFLFIMAQGNTEKLSEAKKVLMYTIIGAAIILGAKGLAIVMQSAVGCVAGASGC